MAVMWGKRAADLSQAEQAVREGFDFLQVAGDLAGSWSEEELRRQGARPAGGIPLTVCAVPLPAEVRVTQRGFNLYVWMEHMKKALQRLAGLGCRQLVWSNGRARILPDEGELPILKEQVLQFLFLLCELAGNFDMTVLVEPLGPRRTNFLNSLKEIEDFLPRVGKENLRCAISLRELGPMGASLSDLAGYRELIAHVQLEDPRPASEAHLCPRPVRLPPIPAGPESHGLLRRHLSSGRGGCCRPGLLPEPLGVAAGRAAAANEKGGAAAPPGNSSC